MQKETRKLKEENSFERLGTASKIFEGMIIEKSKLGPGAYKVYVPNLLPMLDGKNDSRETSVVSRNLNKDANKDIKIEEDNTIIATALVNLSSADPNFAKYDIVPILFMDNDINNARILPLKMAGVRQGISLSSIVGAVANAINPRKDNVNKIDIGDKNSYYAVLDPKNKRVRLHTSKDNGESAGYDIEIDTAKGFLSITDTAGNSIEMVGSSGALTFRNADNATIGMIGGKIQISANEIEMRATSFKTDFVTENINAKQSTIKRNILNAESQVKKEKNLTLDMENTNATIKGAAATVDVKTIKCNSTLIDAMSTFLKVQQLNFGGNPMALLNAAGIKCGTTNLPVADAATLSSILILIATAADAKMPQSTITAAVTQLLGQLNSKTMMQ